MKTQNIILKINQTQVCIKEIIELYISLSTAVRSDSPTHFPGKVLKILLANYTVNQAHKITDNCLLSIATDLLGLIGPHKFHNTTRS